MDEGFDIERHVWQDILPAPGGRTELLAWAGEYFSVRLTRSRPLWEIVSVELAGGGWALISKTHHCMVDGVGSIDIVQTILDTEPEPAGPGRSRVGAIGSPPRPNGANANASRRGLKAVPGRLPRPG